MRHESQLVGSGHETAGLSHRQKTFGRHGRTRLLMLVTHDDAPGVVKTATFHFSGWDDASEAFDALAAVAGIAQENSLAESGVLEASQRDS